MSQTGKLSYISRLSMVAMGYIIVTVSVKYLTTYFKTKTLNPFAVYCVCAGIVSLVVFTLR